MKFSEKKQYIQNMRKAVGKKYKYRQSDYVNWKIRDGYFFCLESLDFMKAEFFVKPLFMDDLYWKIANPYGEDPFPENQYHLSHLLTLIRFEYK